MGHENNIVPQVRFPTMFPMAEIQSVANYLRGSDDAPDAACAAECAWNVVGFGLRFIPHDHEHEELATGSAKGKKPKVLEMKTGAEELSDKNLANKLEREAEKAQSSLSVSTAEAAPVGDEAAIPWNIIVPFALEALKRIIDRWLKR